MARLAQLLGQERTLHHNGKEFKLSPITMEVMGLWEMWLEDRAWSALDRAKKRIPPQQHAEHEKGLLADIAGGIYAFFSDVSEKAQRHPLGDGSRQMLKIRLQLANDGITDEVVSAIVEDQFEELMRLAGLMDAPDPNLQPPEKPGAESALQPSSPASSVNHTA